MPRKTLPWALLVLPLLAASPVLQGGSTGSTAPALQSQPTSQKWPADFSSVHSKDNERSSPQEPTPAFSERDTAGVDDALWNRILNPHDEEEQSQIAEFTVSKNGSLGDTFNDGLILGTSNATNSITMVDKLTPRRNDTTASVEVGSEEFEESLGAVLNDTLSKMKTILMESAEQESDHDWRYAFSRLRVKRSDDGSEDSAELPVTSLNDIVDLFIILARQSLEERGLDQVNIPPLERAFSRSLGIGTLRGIFRGDGGWVRRLTTIQRVANVRLDRGPRPPGGERRAARSVSVATSLGLQQLSVGFERYVADARALPTIKGRLHADIDQNAVLLNISFSKKDDGSDGCDVMLQELQVQRLEGIKMKLTGLGPLNWLLSRIATWLTKHSQEKVARVVEKELSQIVNKEIGAIPCDASFIDAISVL